MENRTVLTPALRPLHDTDVTTWELPNGALARFGRGLRLDIEFSHDAAYLTVATKIGFWIYDLETLKPRALWGNERGMMNVATFSHDSQWIATGDQDGILKVWDTQNGQVVTRIDWGSTRWRNSILHVNFSHNDKYLAASGFGHSAVYDWRGNPNEPVYSNKIEKPKLEDYSKESAAYDRHFPIAFSPNGNLFASVSAPDTVLITNVDSGEDIACLSGNTAPLHSLKFSPCGQFFTGACRGSTVQVWNIHKEALEMQPTTFDGKRVRIAYTSDGSLRVADIYTNRVDIVDLHQQNEIFTFDTLGNTADNARFSNNGKQFAIDCWNNKIQIWKEDTPNTRSFFSGYGSIPYSVAFLQDSSILIGGNWGSTGKLFWDVKKRKVLPTLQNMTKRASFRRMMSLSPDDQHLAVDTSHNDIQVWHVESEELIAELTEHENRIYSLTFSPNGQYLVSGGWTDEVFVWDTVKWEIKHALKAHTGYVQALAFHPDGKLLVSSSRDGTAILWNVVTGEQVSALPLPDTFDDAELYKGEPEEIERVMNGGNLEWKQYQHMESITFSPGGELIAGGLGTWLADGLTSEIRIWDTETLKTRMIILPPQGCIRPWALAFSPCGNYLASGAWWHPGLNRTPIRLWDIKTGENIHTFWGHSSDVQDLAFSPDRKLLASAGFDGTILLWDVKTYIN
ncbi:hypothetical protein F4225_05265 [Candidatus Poribacteria bacterium]|nr:hypothetical protein [Candidatus Poribacteria bacterium]